MIALLLVTALATAPDEPADLREELDEGVFVNWTSMQLEVVSAGEGRGVGATRKAVEALARTGLGERVHLAANGVRVGPELTVEQVLLDPEIGATVEARIDRWAVGEARYFASGRIEIVAELPLLDLLKPVSLRSAVTRPESLRQPEVTGVLIDARGSGASPSWAPAIIGRGDEVLWDGTLWADVAIHSSPLIWLSDPAHMAVARVGDSPLLVRVDRADGARLFLEADDAVRFRTALYGSDVLRSGQIAILVDP